MEVEKYRCIEPFSVQTCDDDGALIDEAPMISVSVGSEYEARRPGLNLDVWLIGDGGWLDLDEETFRECFEKVGA